MAHRLFMLDVPENTGVIKVARDLPGVTVGQAGPYFVIESAGPVSIDRRATGMRHATWYSCVAGLDGWRIAQWDKDALRTADRDGRGFPDSNATSDGSRSPEGGAA